MQSAYFKDAVDSKLIDFSDNSTNDMNNIK